MLRIMMAMLSASLLFSPNNSFAQSTIADSDKQRLLIIYDSSNSMWGELKDKVRKVEAGRTAVEKLIGTGFQGRKVGFRAYGHRRAKDCRDSELIVSFNDPETNGAKISQTVNSIDPKGKTPITYSLQEGLKDIGGKGDILLVTDGIETCDADPCALMEQWKKTNVSIRVHVVGVGLKENDKTAISCIADISGGQFVDAQSAERFAEGLQEVRDAATKPPESETSKPLDVGEAAPKPVDIVKATISFVLPNGETLERNSELWSNGQHVYDVHSSNGVSAKPGTYELRSEDALLPLEPTEIALSGEEQTIQVPIKAAFLDVRYGGKKEDYLTDPDRFFITPQPDGNREFAPLGEPLPISPGSYEISAWKQVGFFENVSITAVNGETIQVVLKPAELGTLTVTYPASEHYLTAPDRAFADPLDGQKIKNGFMRPSEPLKLLPGRYEVKAWTRAGYFDPVIVNVELSQNTDVELTPKPLGKLIVNYDPDAEYKTTPDRASAQPLDGQPYRGSNLNPGEVRKLPPGRYEIRGWRQAGDFDNQIVTITADETTTVTLKLKSAE